MGIPNSVKLLITNVGDILFLQFFIKQINNIHKYNKNYAKY